MKIKCKNCKYSKFSYQENEYKCTNENTKYKFYCYVTGDLDRSLISLPPCRYERNNGCGKEGKWFQSASLFQKLALHEK